MYMIMFVLDDPAKLDALLERWYEIGIGGVTITESTGIHRRRVQRAKLHLTFLMEPVSVGGEEGNYTLFTLVPDQATVAKCLAATEEVVGDLDDPNTGVFSAWPLAAVKGVPEHGKGGEAGS